MTLAQGLRLGKFKSVSKGPLHYQENWPILWSKSWFFMMRRIKRTMQCSMCISPLTLLFEVSALESSMGGRVLKLTQIFHDFHWFHGWPVRVGRLGYLWLAWLLDHLTDGNKKGSKKDEVFLSSSCISQYLPPSPSTLGKWAARP